MAEQVGQFNDYAVKSYRYLRLAIFVMVVVLGASVAIERSRAVCFQGSISAYYFTPAHAAFVGALVAIGVCLIAIKGRSDWEDMLLNVAGMLAPIVAFVPTSPADRMCTRKAFVSPDTNAFVSNNILALAIGGVIALGAAALIASLTGGSRPGRPGRSALVGIVIVGVLILAGLIWYSADETSFRANAHSVAAIAMFVAIGFVVAINWLHARAGYRLIYGIITVAMVVGAVGVLFGRYVVDRDWEHAVFWLEVLEIAPFAVFWLAQTVEHWDAGITPFAEPVRDGGLL
jgi:hypothetical protein